MAQTLTTVISADGADVCCSLLATSLTEAGAAHLARGFAALADPARLQILSMLAAAPAGEICVCELVGPLSKSQPTVSHHLRVLGEAGLVEGERRGKWVWYRLVPEGVKILQSAISLPNEAAMCVTARSSRVTSTPPTADGDVRANEPCGSRSRPS